jgi:hypothetical protein
MKTSGTWNFRSIVGRMMAGLALAALIGSIDVAPAAADDHGRGGRRDNGRYQGRGHGPGHDRGHYRGRRGYRSYGYVEPVYVPPPVYYAPPPAPGVSIFLPTIHIR